MKKKILNLWNNLSDETKKKIISNVKTFVSVFIGVVILMATKADSASLMTLAFWSSALIAGIRAGATALTENYIPVKLGGKKV